MLDKATFMDTLRSVQEIARTSPEPLALEEVQAYFRGMGLSREQEELICQYLRLPAEDPAQGASGREEAEGPDRAAGARPEGLGRAAAARPEGLGNRAAGARLEGLGNRAAAARPEGTERKAAGARSGKPQGRGGQGAGSGARKGPHSAHYQAYLREMERIPALSREQEALLYERLLRGEAEVIAEISSQWLRRIALLAEEYVTGRALVEDLVQEGNMGLLLGMQEILGGAAVLDAQPEGAWEGVAGFGAEREADGFGLEREADGFGLEREAEGFGPEGAGNLHAALERRLEAYAREAMERYRQEIEGEYAGAYTILAKINLIHEAQKVLAQEAGTLPTLEELSQYTRMPEREIREILALSK